MQIRRLVSPRKLRMPLLRVCRGRSSRPLGFDDRAWLRRGVNFGLSGGLTVAQLDGVAIQPLARTSGRTMRLPAEAAMSRPTPYDILRIWPRRRRSKRLRSPLRQSRHRVPERRACRRSGLPSTEGEQPLPEPSSATLTPTGNAASCARNPSAATRSATPAQIVIVADTRFLADDFYIDPRNGAAGC